MSWWNPLSWGAGEEASSLWGGAGSSTGVVSVNDLQKGGPGSLGLGGSFVDTLGGGLGAASGSLEAWGALLEGTSSGMVDDVHGTDAGGGLQGGLGDGILHATGLELGGGGAARDVASGVGRMMSDGLDDAFNGW